MNNVLDKNNVVKILSEAVNNFREYEYKFPRMLVSNYTARKIIKKIWEEEFKKMYFTTYKIKDEWNNI